MVNERRWLASIFLLYFLLAFGFSLLMPVWEAPDEPAHYHLAWRVARGKSYPTYEHNYEAYQPRAYYYAVSLVIRALDQFKPSLSDYSVPPYQPRNYRKPVRMFFWTAENDRLMLGVYSLRWVNVLLGGLALWLSWQAFSLLAPERPALRLASLALGALTPQYLHIMSSVSNDAAGTLAGALLFYLAIRFTKQPSNRLGFSSIILAVVLPFITKLTVLPVSTAVLAIVAWRWFLDLRSKRWLIALGFTLLLGAGVLYVLSPETIRSALSEIKWRLFSFRRNAFTVKYLKFILSQVIWSYWGKVGWLAVGLHAYIVNVLTALGLTGLVLHAGRSIKSKTNDPQFNQWLGTWVIGIFTILAVFRNALTTSATQGRFLFPAIGALSVLMVRGWHEVLPERGQRFLPLFIMILMVSCTLVLWRFGVLPVYYQRLLE
ncbi:MAG TPA: hypothetical protein VI524_09525 [Anaerolineales bacterium]|nr:hypothetical protein [Anaerolineales bacterium]